MTEALGDSPQATRAIWRHLLDIDWMARVAARCLPLDHPLFLLLAAPRWLRFNVRDGLWVRLVDVGTALAAQSYAGRGVVVVEGPVDLAGVTFAAGWRDDGTVKRPSGGAI